MKIPDIIDNRHEDTMLIDIIKKLFRNANSARIATGYFYLNGFDLVKEDLQTLREFQLIIGTKTDIVTREEIATGYQMREQLKLEMIRDINRTEIDDAIQQKRIRDLRDFIAENKKVDVKIYTRAFFHSKAYIFEVHDVEGDLENIGIVGSSNFTRAGLASNTELNNTLKQQSAVNDLKKWFGEIWEESEPFREDLLQIIETSAPYNRIFDKDYLPPFELFKKIIFFYLNRNVTLVGNVLAEFQKIGVENVLDKIQEFNGAIVADSVGLGKTFIGGEIIRRYILEKKRVLCLVPASIINQWEAYLQRFFGLRIGEDLQILSHDKFSRLEEGEVELLKKNDLVLIDEAHRFRNKGPGIKRSRKIELLKGKHFILMTATPLNNSITDIENLINIFIPTNRLISNNLNPQAFKEYNKLVQKERREGLLNEVERQRKQIALQSITAILECVMLLRTRSAIKQQYPNLRIGGRKIEFTNPIIRQEEFSLENDVFKVRGFYEKGDFIANLLSDLYLPHINLLEQEKNHTIEVLYRILLLKRLESSIFAFVQSINNLIASERSLQTDLETLPISSVINSRRKVSVKDLTYIEEDPDFIQYLEDVKEEDKNGKSTLNPMEEDWKNKILTEIRQDLEILERLKKNTGTLLINPSDPFSYKDGKWDQFVNSVLKKESNNKLLIFTQFRDTADYLGYRIRALFPSKVIEVAKGGDKEKDVLAKRFSPFSNDCKVEKNFVFSTNAASSETSNEAKLGPEIDILVSTDTLSEGVNLQDCDYVVNYDLPWNPTRIIQRVGRIDRIGSNDQKYVYNLRADNAIESLLGLMECLKNKVEEIARIVGREHGILSDDEEINIKTIGERIKQVQTTQSMEELELNALNAFFREVQFGERKDSEMHLELRNLIKELALTPEDFQTYTLTKGGYSIIIDGGDVGSKRRFPFIFFKIYDSNTMRSLKNVILKLDLDGKVVEINPFEIRVTPATRGLRKDNYKNSSIIEEQLQQIRQEFEINYFQPFKEHFNPLMKSFGRSFPKVQQEINFRLETMLKQSSLDSWRKESKKQDELKQWKSIFTRIPFKRSDEQALRHLFGDVPILQISNSTFLQVLEEFKKNIIDRNIEYQESISLEKDIKYEEICWGIFI